MPTPRNERGATLPMAIVTIVLLSIGAIAGLNRLQAERRTTGNQAAEVDAFAMAEAALGRYITATTAPPPASLDTIITGLPGGSAAVSVRQLRAAASGVNALYIIRSTATHTGGVRYDTRTPPAQRIVAQFAVWQPGSMRVGAAWTSVTGLDKNGGSGTLSGTDQCGAAPAVAGVEVPTLAADGGPGYDQDGGAFVPSGLPAVSYPSANPVGFAPLIPIDWDAIVNHGALEPDYILSGTLGWPTSWSDWPTIYVTGDVSLGSAQTGQGLLLIRGNAAMNGSFSWNGVILVGGALTSDGNQTIQGAIISGLNVQLGETVAISDVGNGSKTVRYNSCNVSAALDHLGALLPLPNAWVDNWPGW